MKNMMYYSQLFYLTKIMSLLLLVVLLFVGCTMVKQLEIRKERHTTLVLGNIVVREGLFKNNIETKSVPLLQGKLPISFLKKPFDASSSLAYKQTSIKRELPNADGEITIPSFYYELELLDDAAYATLINNNVAAREFVKRVKNTAAVTKIKMVTSEFLNIDNTRAYLEKTPNELVQAVLYDNNKTSTEVLFSDMIIFDYEISYFCFGKDQRNQIAVIDVVEEGKRCKRPLVKKAKKLTKIKNLVDY